LELKTKKKRISYWKGEGLKDPGAEELTYRKEKASRSWS
jgi:hypothetical protein